MSAKYLDTNLASQSVTGVNSHFQVYQEVVKLRKEAVFLEGDLSIEALTNDILVLVRTLSDGSGYALVFNVNNESAIINVTNSFPVLASSGKVIITGITSPKSAEYVLMLVQTIYCDYSFFNLFLAMLLIFPR